MVGWLVAFAVVLRAAASLGMPRTDAAAAIHAPVPALCVRLTSTYAAANRRTGITSSEGAIDGWCSDPATANSTASPTATGTPVPSSTRVIT